MKVDEAESHPKDWEVSVVRSFKEIEEIRPIWEEMQRNEPYPVVDADIDRYISVIKASDGRVQPYVMLFKRYGRPQAIVVGHVSKQVFTVKLGYKALFRPLLNSLSTAYGGIIGQPNSGLYPFIIRELVKLLYHHEVDLIFFYRLRMDSPLYDVARKTPSLLTRNWFIKSEPHWRMSIPESIDHFYQARSPKHRKHLKHYARKLEKAFPGQVKMITYCKEDELDDAIKAISHISAKTYQYGMGRGFRDDFRMQTLLSTAAKLGWFRAHILYVNDEPGAFRCALKYGKTYFASGIGFDPKWKTFRIGTVLFLKVLENLCRERVAEYYDFGFGDAEYKRSYGNEHWSEASICIFAPRFYPIFVNIVQSLLVAANLCLVYALDKIGSTKWIKRRWRNLLQKDKNTKPEDE